MKHLLWIGVLVMVAGCCDCDDVQTQPVDKRGMEEKIGDLYIIYDSLGNRSKEIQLIGDSMFQTIYYHPNGIIEDISFTKNNYQFGKWYRWHDNGMPEYISDTWNGTETEFYENGKIKREARFTTPDTARYVKYWDEEGNTIREEFYDRGSIVNSIEHQKQ